MKDESAVNKKVGAEYREKYVKEQGVLKTKSGLLYEIVKEGTGIKPKVEDTVIVYYKGMLSDSSEFDNSYLRNMPLTISLNSEIKGWTEGLVHAKR